MMQLVKRGVPPQLRSARNLYTTGFRSTLFSTENQPDSNAAVKAKLSKPTPKSGLKLPKLKEGETVVGFRPYGNTDILSKPKNFNFRLQEEINEKRKFKLVIALVVLSMIPFLIFLKNAEANFRKAGVKELHSKRRKRLDEEHGVDRDRMREDFEELDKMYRVTEKEEIGKYKQIGKSAQEYYAQSQIKERHSDEDQQQSSNSVQQEPGVLIKREKIEDGQMEVSIIKGSNFEQVQVSQGGAISENLDPRVGGAKIIFDSRLDRFQTAQQAKEHIKQKQEELPPYTLEDKKKLLIKMLSKESPEQPKSEDAPSSTPVIADDQQKQPSSSSSGFQRQRKSTSAGFKAPNDAEAAPLYVPQNLTPQESLLLEVAEKYNLIMSFLKGYDRTMREYLSFILVNIVQKDLTTSLDEIDAFLKYLESNESEIDTIAHTQEGGESKEIQQAHLRVVLGRKSIEWLIENYERALPSSELDEELAKIPDVVQALTEGIDSQINLYARLIPRFKLYTEALTSLNDYQRDLKILEPYISSTDLALDDQKVKEFTEYIHLQMSKLERKLILPDQSTSIKLIDTEGSLRSGEQRKYSQAYKALNEQIYANQGYQPRTDLPHENLEVSIFLEQNLPLTLEADIKFNKGLLRHFERQVKERLALNYLNVMQDEVRYRMKMEGDILRDTQLLMRKQVEKLAEIEDIIGHEHTYLEIQGLKNEARDHGVMAFNQPQRNVQIEYMNDKTNLMMEIMSKGAPDLPEIETQCSKVLFDASTDATFSSLNNSSSSSESKHPFGKKKECTQIKHIQKALDFLKHNRTLQAYTHLKEAATLKGNNHELNQLIFQVECRMYAEQVYHGLIDTRSEKYDKLAHRYTL